MSHRSRVTGILDSYAQVNSRRFNDCLFQMKDGPAETGDFSAGTIRNALDGSLILLVECYGVKEFERLLVTFEKKLELEWDADYNTSLLVSYEEEFDLVGVQFWVFVNDVVVYDNPWNVRDCSASGTLLEAASSENW